MPAPFDLPPKRNLPGVLDHLYQQYQHLQARQDFLRSQLAAQQQNYRPYNYSGVSYYDPITARPQIGNLLERFLQESVAQTTSFHAMPQMPQQKPPHPDLLEAYRDDALQLSINAKTPDLENPVRSSNGHLADEFDDRSYAGYALRSPLHQHGNSSGSSNSQRLPSAPPTETTPPTSNSADRRSNQFKSVFTVDCIHDQPQRPV